MSEQDTSKESLATSKQPNNTRHNPLELATSNNKWSRKSVLLAVFAGSLPVASLLIYFLTGTEWNTPEIHWLPLSLMLFIIFITMLFLWKKIWFLKNISQFNSWIFGVTLIGGSIAFLLPLTISDEFTKDGEGTALRQMLVYTIGGLLGIITLSETRRKNDLEKKKNKQDQLKNDQDHTRQVHSERRSRYAKAVEQLANEKAAVRLGGIYTLVSLVDEWITDKNKSLTKEDRQKEGQVIINNLCSYIRSPFPLAEKIEEYEARKRLEELEKKYPENLDEEESLSFQTLRERFKDSDEYKKPEDIVADYAELHEEEDVRRTIFVAMSERSSVFNKNKKTITSGTRGIWSDFDFDFSRAPIFYPLNNLTVEKGNFVESTLYSNAKFNETLFTSDVDFSSAIFTCDADFNEAKFVQNATFDNATFNHAATFDNATFNHAATFDNATFNDAKFNNTTFNEAIFDKATFNEAIFDKATFNKAIFDKATFSGDATFEQAWFSETASFSSTNFNQNAKFEKVVFNQDTNFINATFSKNTDFKSATFTQNANFYNATFAQNTNFESATFTQNANFYNATFAQNTNFENVTFEQNANFSWVTFKQDATFNSAKFTQEASFYNVTFGKNSKFNEATFSLSANFSQAIFEKFKPIFAVGSLRARFSAQAIPDNYSFSVRAGSKPIPPGEAELDGIKRRIPVGTVLVDPDSGRISEPAKPIDKFDNQGETPSK